MSTPNELPSLAETVCRQVSHERLNRWILELASIGGREDGGVSRETLTAEDWQARRWLIDLAQSLGCIVYQDACANLFFERTGTRTVPGVLTGSHQDTQPVGGKYDGAYGVIAGLELIAALNAAQVQTSKPITVVCWTSEEGSRFGPGAMGSSFFSQPARLAEHYRSMDKNGVSFEQALTQTLHEFRDIEVRTASPIDQYIELHIEQGPVLENAGSSLGIVTSIQAVNWYKITCSGRMAHAGTTPMDQRQDAMQTAITLAHQLWTAAQPFIAQGLKFTIGSWNVAPNSVNTVAGSVTFTCDIRAENSHLVEAFGMALQQLCEQTPNTQAERFFARDTTHFPKSIVAVIEQACDAAQQALDLKPALTLPSGAFHDAMYVAECAQAGMIFVPSRKGISHNAAEYTHPDDLYRGVWALTHAVVTLANS